MQSNTRQSEQRLNQQKDDVDALFDSMAEDDDNEENGEDVGDDGESLGDVDMLSDDGFIVDDDGAGYAASGGASKSRGQGKTRTGGMVAGKGLKRYTRKRCDTYRH